MEPYNKEFSIHELQAVIKRAKATSPGPDKISNLMIKNAQEGAQEFLLKMINKFWKEGYFCEKWRLATVVPIPKPGKYH